MLPQDGCLRLHSAQAGSLYNIWRCRRTLGSRCAARNCCTRLPHIAASKRGVLSFPLLLRHDVLDGAHAGRWRGAANAGGALL